MKVYWIVRPFVQLRFPARWRLCASDADKISIIKLLYIHTILKLVHTSIPLCGCTLSTAVELPVKVFLSSSFLCGRTLQSLFYTQVRVYESEEKKKFLQRFSNLFPFAWYLFLSSVYIYFRTSFFPPPPAPTKLLLSSCALSNVSLGRLSNQFLSRSANSQNTPVLASMAIS